jgi:heme-degrading monooxygenase HmoA
MYIIVKRKLKDFDSWKKMVSEQNDTRKQMGSKGAVVYRNAKNPDEVFLIFEWEDEKSFMDYFKLTEVQKALEETGTTEIIEISESFKLEA